MILCYREISKLLLVPAFIRGDILRCHQSHLRLLSGSKALMSQALWGKVFFSRISHLFVSFAHASTQGNIVPNHHSRKGIDRACICIGSFTTAASSKLETNCLKRLKNP